MFIGFSFLHTKQTIKNKTIEIRLSTNIFVNFFRKIRRKIYYSKCGESDGDK